MPSFIGFPPSRMALTKGALLALSNSSPPQSPRHLTSTPLCLTSALDRPIVGVIGH
jgi:hypothetical protein